MRIYKYSKGTVYADTRPDMVFAQFFLPPTLRQPMLERLHPSQMGDAMAAPFDLEKCLNTLLTIEETQPSTMGLATFIVGDVYDGELGEEGFKARREFIRETVLPTKEELRTLQDDELKERMFAENQKFCLGRCPLSAVNTSLATLHSRY